MNDTVTTSAARSATTQFEQRPVDGAEIGNTSASTIALPDTLPILYGSEMGNAELVADNLKDALEAQGVQVECIELNDQPVEELANMSLALFVTSTSGEGDMPYTAERFWQRLSAEDAPSLVDLRFAVLALGDSGYTYFCGAGVSLDERLAELGATRIADRVDCDVNYDAPANAWIAARVEQLITTHASGDNPAAHTEHKTSAPAAPVAPNAKLFASSQWTRDFPFQARLLSSELLTSPESAKEIRHYEIDISGSDIPYRPGDSVAVIPTNTRAAVEAFLAAAGATGTDLYHGESLNFLAKYRWELRFPSAALLDAVTQHAPESPLARALADGDRAAGEEWIRDNGVCETLHQLPSPLSIAELGDAMGPIRYRAYSIASSPKTHPNTMHLTVATQRNPQTASLSAGVGSGYLADLLEAGDEINIFPLSNRSFHLPEDPATPIIMVGPGVGIAPFRSYLLDRAAGASTGPSWLFYGDQHERTDFVYRAELEALQASGALTRLSTAFSRDQAEKFYVQDRMREHAAELTQWLRDGAYLYVCGDGKRMAADVDRALQEIVSQELGAAAGAQLLEQLHHERRYLRDVY